MGNPGVHTALDEEVVVAVMCLVVWVRGGGDGWRSRWG